MMDLDGMYSQKAWLSEPRDIYESTEAYTGRDSTFNADARTDISVILRRYKQKFQMHRLWGMLWLSDDRATSTLPKMTHGLFLTTSKGRLRRRDFPSWSWAGWPQSVS